MSATFGLWLLSSIAAQSAVPAGDATPAGLRYVFPADATVLDARRDLGAKGDGVAA